MLDVADKFINFPTLETERCLLRSFVSDDVHDVFDYMSDDSVTQYLPWDSVTTLDEARIRMQRYYRIFKEQTGFVWAIVNKSNDKVMGMCLLFHFSLDHHRAEIGYALGADWWRQGFMTEVASAVIDYGFDEMGFHSMEAKIDPANVGSQRLLEKVGFVQEAYYRENYYDEGLDKFTDTAVFSLLKSTWISKD